jgi:hypothetical protein
MSTFNAESPVALPPGRPRLATNPLPIGSVASANTMGISDVGSFATSAGMVAQVATTSTFARTNSAAISAARSRRPSAQRISNTTLRPSLQPNSFSRCTRAANQWLATAGPAAPKKPMIRNFACCAIPATGHAAAAPPSSAMNSRLTQSPRRRWRPGLEIIQGRAPSPS